MGKPASRQVPLTNKELIPFRRIGKRSRNVDNFVKMIDNSHRVTDKYLQLTDNFREMTDKPREMIGIHSLKTIDHQERTSE
ncbi:hypothetical protein [Sporosarcina sp. SAFN-015]|uniref:hypothetical protein n=1 Tax=Sporosarcina sp. SAFN-015 TaxID=3387274 RepID=UPI003F7F773A